MAAPKELKSPGSAGRPENVKPPVAGIDADMAAMEALSDSDLADMKAMEALDLGPSSPMQGMQMGGAARRDLLSKEELASITPSREMGADIAASLATQIPVRAGAAVLASPGGPFGMYLAQQTAGAGAAYFEKDVANAFRRAIGAPENEERDRATDVAMSFLMDLPGAGTASEAIGRSTVKSAIRSLSPELQSTVSALRSAIMSEANQYLDKKSAANLVANSEKEFGEMIAAGYSPKQAISSTVQKYNFQIRALKAQDELLSNVGKEMTFEEAQKGIVARPAKIIELKTDRAIRRQRIALEAVRQTKGLDMVDPGRLIDELKIGLSAAESTGNKPLVDNINNLIDALADRRKLVTESNDMALFSKSTGGKPQNVIDVSTGAVMSSGAQDTGPARLLPPNLADANENRVLQSIDSLITKRINLDNEIASMPESARRSAAIKAVTALRDVEDQFMMNLRNRGGDYAKIADEYMSAKQSLFSLNSAKENMRGLVNQDAAGIAMMLEGKSVDEIKAWASVMPSETKNRVARRYVEGLIQKTAGLPERPFTQGQFNSISAALKDKVQVAKLSSLIGEEAAQSAAKDMDNLSKLVAAASKMPKGSNPERAVIRRVGKAVGDFARKYKLDFFFSGRMALPPESRYYDDFIKYIVSTDFGGMMASLNGPREIASAASEISRVYGRNSPMAQKFYESVTAKGMLPYVGGKVIQSELQGQGGSQE